MKDDFEAFIKNKLEEGVAPSLSSLSVIKHAAKENLAARRTSYRIRFFVGGLVAAVLSVIIALTVLFQIGAVDSCEMSRASKSLSISHCDNVTIQIIELLSVNDVENQDFAHISSDIDRLLSWQDAPYNEIAYEYSNQF
ncbi:MAG: hypothetical protein J6V45_04575 [Kiritimatiellae bacterium]|nr:hypothetical protein [Kiritimatiellia bacterium]